MTTAVQLKARALAVHLASLPERSRVPAVASVFSCVQPPPISLDGFAERLGEHLFCSEAPFVAAYVLLDRLFARLPALFCDLSLHKLLSACMVVAIKLQEDTFYSSRHYAMCCGVDVRELNELEAVFAKLLDFELFVGERDGFLAGVELARLETWLRDQHRLQLMKEQAFASSNNNSHRHQHQHFPSPAFPQFDFFQDINWQFADDAHHHHHHHAAVEEGTKGQSIAGAPSSAYHNDDSNPGKLSPGNGNGNSFEDMVMSVFNAAMIE